MGAALFDQLQNYLRSNHPKIGTINLIGHSLGGLLVIRKLKNFHIDSGWLSTMCC
ncbi:hypothetical protein ACI2KR_12420 [Pseudomonas luteola]